MDCKEKILSNQYADGVVDFPVERIVEETEDICFIPIGGRYYAVYQNRADASSLLGSTYQYQYIPKIYGLMQVEGRIFSGNSGNSF